MYLVRVAWVGVDAGESGVDGFVLGHRQIHFAIGRTRNYTIGRPTRPPHRDAPPPTPPTHTTMPTLSDALLSELTIQAAYERNNHDAYLQIANFWDCLN